MSPTAPLIPTGSPVSAASSSTKSSRLSSSSKARCRAGLAQSRPIGIPRMSEISLVTFAAGSRPPRPGLAPCESLISIALTGAESTTSLSLARLKFPCSSRQPKYAVPICSTMSPPWRWCGESPPSPVLCMQPASFAPALSALIALLDSDPKLIAEMLISESGRNALARPRAPPSTFALGSPVFTAWSRGSESANVRCLMIA